MLLGNLTCLFFILTIHLCQQGAGIINGILGIDFLDLDSNLLSRQIVHPLMDNNLTLRCSCRGIQLLQQIQYIITSDVGLQTILADLLHDHVRSSFTQSIRITFGILLQQFNGLIGIILGRNIHTGKGLTDHSPGHQINNKLFCNILTGSNISCVIQVRKQAADIVSSYINVTIGSGITLQFLFESNQNFVNNHIMQQICYITFPLFRSFASKNILNDNKSFFVGLHNAVRLKHFLNHGNSSFLCCLQQCFTKCHRNSVFKRRNGSVPHLVDQQLRVTGVNVAIVLRTTVAKNLNVNIGDLHQSAKHFTNGERCLAAIHGQRQHFALTVVVQTNHIQLNVGIQSINLVDSSVEAIDIAQDSVDRHFGNEVDQVQSVTAGLCSSMQLFRNDGGNGIHSIDHACACKLVKVVAILGSAAIFQIVHHLLNDVRREVIRTYIQSDILCIGNIFLRLCAISIHD